MKEVLMFQLANCPHCRLAHQWMDELFDEYPEWKEIPLRVVDEREEPALADAYEYYYVPTFYVDGRKLHEGHAEKPDVEKVFRAALEETAPV